MADLTITAAEVLKGSSGNKREGTAGEAITQGQAVVKIGTAVYLSDADHTTTTYNDCSGIAINAAQSGQPVDYISSDDDFTIGTTNPPTPGKVYVVSRTAGGIAPVDDLSTATTQKVTIVGVGLASGKLKLAIVASATALTS